MTTAPPVFYDYDEATAILHCAKSWLPENISRLPHCKFGASVSFTPEHLVEIGRLHEIVPAVSPIPLATAAALDITPRGSRRSQQFPDLKPRRSRASSS
nr:hypothetical protein [Streptomyces sp. SID3343]